MSEVIKCPVCGAEKKQLSLSDYDCGYCGFNNAFVKAFASEKSYKAWKESVKNAIKQFVRNKRRSLTDSRCLRVGNGTIAFLELDNNNITIVQSNGRTRVEEDAIQFDSSERNYAIVYKNGTVKVFGNENEFGQKNTETWTNIRQILTAPNCTYGVTNSGTIIYAGSPADKTVLKWSNIRALRSYEDCLVGIRTDDSIVLPENTLLDTELKKSEEWKNIKDVVLFRDCVAGLTKNDTIIFLGKKDDPKRACMTWRDIIAIEADNSYIYGLSKDGEVFVAGNCNTLLDKGRKNVVTWKDIMIIACNRAGIGAVNEKGDFLFAGTIAGDKTKIIDVCKNCTSALIP